MSGAKFPEAHERAGLGARTLKLSAHSAGWKVLGSVASPYGFNYARDGIVYDGLTLANSSCGRYSTQCEAKLDW
jgi:hypothetical protein